MTIALLAALLSAVCFGVGAVLQAGAANAEPDRGGVDAGLLVRLATRGRFVAGVALDIVGFGAQFFALRTLAVFVVQAVQAGNLAVTAIAAIPILGARLRGREWAAIAAVVIGLGMLAVGSATERTHPVSDVRWVLLAGVVVTTALGYAVGHVKTRLAPAALGLMAGLGFGIVALAARVLTDLSIGHLLRDPALYTVVFGGIASFLLFATSLQRGAVTTVIAAVIVGETVVPALAGVLILGDHTRPGLAPLAVAGFAISVTGAVLLARFGIGTPHPPISRSGADADSSALHRG